MRTPSIASVATLLSFFGLSTSSPLQRLEERVNHVKARQGGTFDITGAVGGVQPRLEIRDMQNNAPLWNLFLAAFEQWQAVDQDDMLSYFQIAAIHGQPLQPWDGVESTGSDQIGYCPHSSNVFGTWHRPYLAVFEQLLQAQAINIANALPDGDTKTQYQGLAQQLRWPHWDWALNNGGPIIPESITTETISIAYPNGTTANRPNPLYQYEFHPLQENWFGGNYNVWPRTVRNPSNVKNINSPSDNAATESILQNGHESRRQSLYNILTQHQTFNEFSNHGSGNSPIGSLESIHDGIHSAFGDGHMFFLTVSAFDPIFWLHHANVDRLITLFQWVYPDTWIEPWAQGTSTWVYERGTTLDKWSPLQPFHDSTSGSVWNSATVADVRSLGYTYPELTSNPSNATLRATINKLYGSTTDQSATSISSRTTDSLNTRAVAGKTYLAAIEAPLTALNGPYEVQVWLGQTPSLLDVLDILNPTTPTSPSYVGSMAVLAQSDMVSSDIVRGSVPLTARLNDNAVSGVLSDLGLDGILGNLQTQLHYRVVQNGQEVPREKIPGLKVAVFSADVEPAESEDAWPVWGPLVRHDVTDGWGLWQGEEGEDGSRYGS